MLFLLRQLSTLRNSPNLVQLIPLSRLLRLSLSRLLTPLGRHLEPLPRHCQYLQQHPSALRPRLELTAEHHCQPLTLAIWILRARTHYQTQN